MLWNIAGSGEPCRHALSRARLQLGGARELKWPLTCERRRKEAREWALLSMRAVERSRRSLQKVSFRSSMARRSNRQITFAATPGCSRVYAAVPVTRSVVCGMIVHSASMEFGARWLRIAHSRPGFRQVTKRQGIDRCGAALSFGAHLCAALDLAKISFPIFSLPTCLPRAISNTGGGIAAGRDRALCCQRVGL